MANYEDEFEDFDLSILTGGKKLSQDTDVNLPVVDPEPVEPPKAQAPVKPAEPPKPVEPPKAKAPVKPAEPPKPVEPPKAKAPVKPAEPPKKPAEPPKAQAPVKPVEPEKPAPPPKLKEAPKDLEPVKQVEPPRLKINRRPAEAPEVKAPAGPVEAPESAPVVPTPQPAPESRPARKHMQPVDMDDLDMDTDSPFDSVDISDRLPAPVEKPDVEAIAESISTKLNEAAEDYRRPAAPTPAAAPARKRREEEYDDEEYYDDDEYDDDYYDDDEYDDDDEDERSVGGVIRILLAAILGIAVVGVCAFGVNILMEHQKMINFYRSHFLPATTINGIDCSDMSVEDVAIAFEKELENYTLTIEGKDENEIITKQDAGLTMSIDLDFKDLLAEQDHASYRTAAEEPKNYTITTAITVDEASLMAKLQSLLMFVNMTPSSDCKVEYDIVSGQYVLYESVHGNEVSLYAVCERVIECCKTLRPSVNLEEEGFYGEVVDATDEIRADVAAMNKALGAQVALDFDVAGTEAVTKEMIRQCLKTDEKVRLAFDPAPLEAWINELSSTYDTQGTVHPFTTTAGDEISITGGNFGWKMDPAGTASLLKEAILGGEMKTMEPAYTSKAGSHGENDIGSTYIEIDLTNQRLYYYRSGEQLLTRNIISGDVKEGKRTPTGVYTILKMEQNKTMNILGNDRTVDNWMLFYENYGICDASWRSNFGGDIYVTDGTLGSIYISDSDSLAQYAEVGTPVVIYGGKTSYTPPAPQTRPTTRPTQPTATEPTDDSGSETGENPGGDEPGSDEPGGDEPGGDDGGGSETSGGGGSGDGGSGSGSGGSGGGEAPAPVTE